MINKVATKFTVDDLIMLRLFNHVHTDFTNKYGWLEAVFCQREISEKRQTEELNLLNQERGTSFKMNDQIEVSVTAWDLIYNRTRIKDYTTKVEPKPITPIVSEGEIQEYSTNRL